MYSFVLTLHNILRWLVLIIGLFAIIRAFIGWFGNKEWQDLDDRLGLGFTSSLDLQVLLGLLLYFFFSPITSTAFSDFGAAMSDSNVRFFLVEHGVMMLIAIILAHIGRSRAKKQETDIGKYKNTAIFFGLAMIVILISIPWFRPLLPF
jgi:hypothetical protein